MNDLRLALRALRSTPIVTSVAILSLALGIGANTAIFSIVDSLVLKALPVADPATLVLVTEGTETESIWTNPIWEQIRDREPALFAAAFAWSDIRFDLAQGGEATFANGLFVSGGFFDGLGVPPILGRTLTPGDDRRVSTGSDPSVAVLSYAFWQRHFAGAADVVGRSITLDRHSFTIVGVAAHGFSGPTVGRAFDVAVPMAAEAVLRGKESMLDHRSAWWLDIMGRLRPDQTTDAAARTLRGIQPQIREATRPQNWRKEEQDRYLSAALNVVPASTGPSFLRERYRQPLLTIMAVVGLVLLIACANIANLMLARATARRHELSVRVALGASRWQLARLLLAEATVLAAAGAALGLVFARWGSRLLVGQLSTMFSAVTLDMPLDWRVLGFTAAVASGTALLFGTAPALRSAEAEPVDALKAHGRGVAGRPAVASSLVVAQVALSLVPIVAAGLFVGTFTRLARVDLGFNRDAVLVAAVDTAESHAAPKDRAAVLQRAAEAAAQVPGVAGAAASELTPMGGLRWNDLFLFDNLPTLGERDRIVNMNAVAPGWFSVLGTPLVAGRDFNRSDVKGSTPVVIVNEAYARKYLGGSNPVGTFATPMPEPNEERQPLEIVGLVKDAVYSSLRAPVPPTAYVPLGQTREVLRNASISVRAAGGSPAALSRSVAAAIARVDPDLSLTFRPLAAQIDFSVTQERLVAILSGFFGLLALLLAGIGLYGVTAYSVSGRRAEFGLRMALGADANGVLRLVLGRVAALVIAGIAIGAVIALWASTFVSTLLFGLPPRDPATLAASMAVLIAIGGIAGWLPARRASRIEPAEALREN